MDRIAPIAGKYLFHGMGKVGQIHRVIVLRGQTSFQRGQLRIVLEDFTLSHGTLWMLWPTSQHASPKLRALIDFLKAHLLPGSDIRKS